MLRSVHTIELSMSMNGLKGTLIRCLGEFEAKPAITASARIELLRTSLSESRHSVNEVVHHISFVCRVTNDLGCQSAMVCVC